MIIATKFDGYGEGGRLTSTRRVYDSGSSAPSKTTQVSDLPEWAKPYAKQTLALTESLTTKKDAEGNITPGEYPTYQGERIEGFNKLQKQAFTGAENLAPSQLGAQAGQFAGAATLGALGTNYDPYQTGQFTSQAASQYMNPYLEQAMEPQLREAQRASEIGRTQQQAQAVGAGAFGGSRQAIVEAERQRNLAQQQGDIRARGYMTAFDQAQQQFAREQQLREQSRQYGAGLGLQGLQTALTGAGQMGALGGQQFGQQKEALGLQQQFGSQQQALEQQRLNQQYQDFLNQQRYPYQQLEFMSSMLRGTPMGTVQTLYQPPASTLGQLAGIGAGIYGMTRKEGGTVHEYAGGGSVDSPENVAEIVGRLSDAQLAQSKQAAEARGDTEQLQAIFAEERRREGLEQAMQASEYGGLAGAFNSLPESTQQAVTEMAGGGIVAFADRGLVQEPTPEEIEAAKKPYVGMPMFRRPPGKEYGESNFFPQLGEAISRSGARLGAALLPAYAVDKPAVSSSDGSYDRAERQRLAQDRSSISAAAPKPKPKPEAPRAAKTSITQIATKMADDAGMDRDTFTEKFKELEEYFNKSSQKGMESLFAEVEKNMGGSKEVKEKALGRALAEFGFKWAAAAAKPGAKFLSSAAEASPTLAASMAESDKLAREMDQNDMKLRLNLKQFEIAQRKGDMRTAAALAGQVRALEQSQAQLRLQRDQLAEMSRSNRAKEGILQARAAAAGPAALAKSSAAIMRNYGTARERALDRAQRLAKADFEAAALNPAAQKTFQQRGITSAAQLYEIYADRELSKLNKGYISNVAPDEDEDE